MGPIPSYPVDGLRKHPAVLQQLSEGVQGHGRHLAVRNAATGATKKWRLNYGDLFPIRNNERNYRREDVGTCAFIYFGHQTCAKAVDFHGNIIEKRTMFVDFL